MPSPITSGPQRTISFERGELYNRQRDIHEVFRGQERGGISTPTNVPFVFLFTGESGEQFGFGYRDRWRDDGSFGYTGEGQRGDMEFVRGNRAGAGLEQHSQAPSALLRTYVFTVALRR